MRIWSIPEYLSSTYDFAYHNLQRLLKDPLRSQYVCNVIINLINPGHVEIFANCRSDVGLFYMDSNMTTKEKPVHLTHFTVNEGDMMKDYTNDHYIGKPFGTLNFPNLPCGCIQTSTNGQLNLYYVPLEDFYIEAKEKEDEDAVFQKMYMLHPLKEGNVYKEYLDNPHLYPHDVITPKQRVNMIIGEHKDAELSQAELMMRILTLRF